MLYQQYNDDSLLQRNSTCLEELRAESEKKIRNNFNTILLYQQYNDDSPLKHTSTCSEEA